MTKQEILVNVFTKLRFSGFVDSKKTFAQMLDYNYTCLSAAMNGEERYLTERLFKRVLKAYPNVNPQYLNTGEGEILLTEGTDCETFCLDDTLPAAPTRPTYTGSVDIWKLIDELAQQRELTKRAQEQTEKAQAQIDQLIEILKSVTFNPNK